MNLKRSLSIYQVVWIRSKISITNSPDFESYEVLLKEQFDTMKASFVKKIDQLNDEICTQRTGFRKKISYLEEELNQTKHVKDLLVKQVTEFQKLNKE
jgi:hypothetical protein